MMGNDKEQWRRGVGKRKQKRQTGKRKARVLPWEEKPDFFDFSMQDIFPGLSFFRIF